MALRCSPDIFRNALDHIPDAVLISDGTGAVRFANRHAPRLLGYAVEELLGRDIERLMPEHFRRSRIPQTDPFVAAEGDQPPGSARPLAACRKDGSGFPAQITLGSIEDAHGIFLVAAIRDLTAYQDLSRDLSFARAAAAHAERAAQQAREALAVTRRANAARWTSASYLLRQQLQALSILNGLLGRSGRPDDVALTHALSSQAEAIAAMMNLLDPLGEPHKLDSSSVAETETPAEAATRVVESITGGQPTSSAAPAAQAHHTVLIVLRDWAMLEAAAGLLRISGYDVLAARNGEEAQTIARLRPEVGYVLTEQALGSSETGAAVIDTLRSRLGAHLKSILISDDPVIAQATRFDSGDLTRVARMPIRAEELLRMMNDLRHDAIPRIDEDA